MFRSFKLGFINDEFRLELKIMMQIYAAEWKFSSYQNRIFDLVPNINSNPLLSSNFYSICDVIAIVLCPLGISR